MPRRWLQNQLPDNAQLRKRLGVAENTAGSKLGWLNKTLSEPMLWHLNRRSAAGAVAVGLFVSWMPVPLQMLVAASIAAMMRVHVPVSVVMVWFTNPLTLGPVLYAAWIAGSTILGVPSTGDPTSLSLISLLEKLRLGWPVFLVGSLFCASVTAVVGYLLTLLIWRVGAIWRWRNRQSRVARPSTS